MKSQRNKPELNVVIKDRVNIMYDGKATTLTSSNITGPFDVLPQHANFISLISGSVLIDQGMATEKKFEIENGLMYVMLGKVEVYVGI